jgi:predicted tellurium resistance membrane protein TerC
VCSSDLVVLMAEGLDMHFSKGYVYTAMGFSVAVELLNLRMRRAAAHPVTADRHPA